MGLVSVVTPAYNEEKYIKETLDSIRNQDYSPIEHIIINDGSTDSTESIVKEYKEDNDGKEGYSLRLFSQKNQGQSKSLNKGFSLAKGEIVIWLNANDCLFKQNSVRVIEKYFSENPEKSIAYGNRITIDDQNKIKNIRLSVPWYNRDRLERWYFAAFIFMRKEVVDNFPIDEQFDYKMDYDHALRIAEAGKNFGYIHEFLLCFRIHEGTAKTNPSGQKEREVIKRKHGLENQKIRGFGDTILNQMLRLKALSLMGLGRIDMDNTAFDIELPSLTKRMRNQLKSFSGELN